MSHRLQSLAHSSLQVHSLRQQLDETRKKLQDYTDLIVSQANELKTFRENVCRACKEKIFRANLEPGSPPQVAIPSHSNRDIQSRIPIRSPVGTSRASLLRPMVPPVSGTRGTTIIPSPVVCVTPPQTQPRTSGIQSNVPPKPEPKQHRWKVVQNNAVNPGPAMNFELVLTHDSYVHSVRFSPDGRYCAVGLGFTRGKTYIYNTRNWETTCVLVDYNAKAAIGVWAVCFNPDNSTLATGGSRGMIWIWEILKKRVRASFKGHKRDVRSLDFSPNGHFLVSGAEDYTICIWKIRDGFSKVFSAEGLRFLTFPCVRYSLNGNYVAAGNVDNSSTIWNVRTGRLVERWIGHKDTVCSLAFTPDGKGLITAGNGDCTIKYWNIGLTTPRSAPAVSGSSIMAQGAAVEKAEVMTFTGPTREVSSIAVSPNGHWVLAGGVDNTARIWNARDAVWQCSLQGHDAMVRAVDFSPRGDYVVLGSFDRRVSVWKFQTVSLS